MSSQASAAGLVSTIGGLIFFAFPLHPAGKPDDSRAEHLSKVPVPMLFLQGERDALADLNLLKPVVAKLGGRAELKLFEYADHSFHVPAKSGRTDAQLRDEMLDEVRNWISARGA
jgi:predicted alpha/beta-hydrolase family hydrolase